MPEVPKKKPKPLPTKENKTAKNFSNNPNN